MTIEGKGFITIGQRTLNLANVTYVQGGITSWRNRGYAYTTIGDSRPGVQAYTCVHFVGENADTYPARFVDEEAEELAQQLGMTLTRDPGDKDRDWERAEYWDRDPEKAQREVDEENAAAGIDEAV